MNSPPSTEAPKLAAILAIDVVGYSRLMRENEAQTLAALKDVRTSVIDPIAASYNGRLFKAMGDGFLLEFGSVANAVQCAIEIQQKMLARNAERTGAPTLEFRMGLNVADIIPDKDDVFGDGVNVAARLEALAEPSGICISGAVYEQIRHTFGDLFKHIGPKALKNIEMPIEVYTAHVGRRHAPSIFERIAALLPARRPLAIASAAGLLVAVVGAAAIIEFDFRLSADGGGEPVNAEPGAAVDRGAAPAHSQTEAERINEGAETEAAKVKAKAAVAAAKAEADAAAAEAQARAQVLKRAVDAWKEASLALTEATKNVRDAEAKLAELKARLVAARESDPAEVDARDRARALDTLAQRVSDTEESLKIAQARHDAAVNAEKGAREHMEKLKAEALPAEN